MPRLDYKRADASYFSASSASSPPSRPAAHRHAPRHAGRSRKRQSSSSARADGCHDACALSGFGRAPGGWRYWRLSAMMTFRRLRHRHFAAGSYSPLASRRINEWPQRLFNSAASCDRHDAPTSFPRSAMRVRLAAGTDGVKRVSASAIFDGGQARNGCAPNRPGTWANRIGEIRGSQRRDAILSPGIRLGRCRAGVLSGADAAAAGR